LLPALGLGDAAKTMATGAVTFSTVGLVALVSVALAWIAGRRAGRHAMVDAQQIGSVLEFADCLLWQASVELLGEDWRWKFSLQPTGLSQRLFGEANTPELVALWRQFEIPEQPEMNARCRAALLQGESKYEQQFHFEKDGKTIWLRESVAITRVARNRFKLVGLATDITSQREAELARRASEDRVRQLLSRSDCMLWQADVTLREDGSFSWKWFIPNSELYRQILGGTSVAPDALWDNSMVPEFAEMRERSRVAIMEGAPGYEQEFRVVRDSTLRWLHERVTIEAAGQNRWTLEGVIIDITAQRRAEESKRASEAELERVVEIADFMLWHANVFQSSDGNLRWVLHVPRSTLYRRVFGRDPVEPIVMPWNEFVTPEGYETMLNRAHGAILAGAGSYAQKISGEREGRTVWLHEQATIREVAPGEWQLVGMVTDVTAGHEAEAAREASERALHEILERADCLLWRATVVRRDGGVHWLYFDLPASRLGFELLGTNRSARTDRLWDDGDVPDMDEMNARSLNAILSGATEYEQEFRMNRNGRLFYLHEQVTVFSVGPDEWRLVGVVTDVTQRHEAEEARLRSEARLEQLLEAAECMIWHGMVTSGEGDTFNWDLYVPRSRLHRRIFGKDPTKSGFHWADIGVPEYDAMVKTTHAAFVGGAPGYEQVFHIPKPEGDIWVTEQVSITPAGPARWQAVGVITDITARHNAEEARRVTEAQLKQILELADCMVWEATVTPQTDGQYDWKVQTTRSVLFRRIFGEDDTAANFNWMRVNVPERGETEQRATDALRKGLNGYEHEFRVVSGYRVIWLHEVVTISPLASGQSRLVGVITDITVQREAQEAQKASEAQVEQMLASAECMLWAGRVFEISPGQLRWVLFIPRSRLYRELFGCDPTHPITVRWEEIIDPATHREIETRARTAILAGDRGYEQEFRAQRDDRTFWLHERVSITPVGPAEWKLTGIMTDLSARRAAEQAMRASELRYRTLYRHTPVAIIEADFTQVGKWLDELRVAGVKNLREKLNAEPRQLLRAAKMVRFVDCNNSAMTMLKVKSKIDFQRRRRALETPESIEVIKLAMLSLWEGRNTLEAEMKMRDFEGGMHDIQMRWWMERTDDGLDFSQSVMVFLDLTDLKKAEAALAAEKERLAVTLRAMAEGVITTDVAGIVQFINPAAAAFIQRTEAEVIGLSVADICQFEDDRTGAPVELPVARVARGDVVIDLPSRTKLAVADGAHRLVEGCCAPIHAADSAVIGTVLVFRDVTEHERLEQELVRATKLESVGILAGGIAHDFNNILTAVMGNVALASLDVDPACDAGRSLREAEKATLRARDLTQQLLTFAKGGEPVRSAIQLDGIVREMTTFTLHGSPVKPLYDFPEGLWPADADKGQIGRVVQNLVLNAVQAMPEGGTVKIKLSNERIPGLGRASLAAGNYVKIAISDTGVGIKPEHLPRIFDPYFTTKQMGSGLGLAAVYSIVNKHRGTIDVESRIGVGTTFRIWLPASPVEAVVDAPAPVGEKIRLKGRILFMDDEEPIRQMATFLLRRFGFDVECAADGAEALRKYREVQNTPEAFAVVIMDLTVPGGMGGREAVGHLRALDPNVKAIVSSGYSSDPVLANYRAHGFCGVAAKPYEVNDLARVLRDALAASEAERAIASVGRI
jgi:PAS domain S-box-containing protein